MLAWSASALSALNDCREPLLSVAERPQPLLSEGALVLEVGVRAHEIALELAGAGRLLTERAQPRAERHQDEPGTDKHADQQP